MSPKAETSQVASGKILITTEMPQRLVLAENTYISQQWVPNINVPKSATTFSGTTIDVRFEASAKKTITPVLCTRDQLFTFSLTKDDHGSKQQKYTVHQKLSYFRNIFHNHCSSCYFIATKLSNYSNHCKFQSKQLKTFRLHVFYFFLYVLFFLKVETGENLLTLLHPSEPLALE